MENRIQLLKLCNKIVGVICILFMLIDLLDGASVKALILLICSLVGHVLNVVKRILHN